MKVSACVFFSQQPSGLFSVSLPQTETAARSTSQVNSHSCWLALHQHHTHRNVNVSRSTNKPDQKQGSQIPLGEPMLCCLVCFPAPPSSVCWRKQQAGRSLAATRLPALPAQSRQSIAKLSLLSPSTSRDSPCAANSRFHYSAPPPSFQLGFFETTFHSLTVRVKKKPYSPLRAVECEFLQKFQRC